MDKLRLGLAAAVIPAAGAAALAWQQQRRRRLTVTLYSEPWYQGICQTFGPGRQVRSLVATRLPRVGSVRVAFLRYTFRRAAAFPRLLRAAVTDPENRSEAVGWLPLAALQVADPGAWRRQHDPEGDVQSWALLWAESPGPEDRYRQTDGERWRYIVEDTPDLGEWGARARYIEVGTCSPYRLETLRAP